MRYSLCLAALIAIIYVSHGEEGDYVNQFVIFVNGGEAEADEVVKHISKRNAVLQSKLHTDAYGYTLHFVHNDIQGRAKRSADDHSFVKEMANHPLVTSIEQQRELVRVKRDFQSEEEIERARRAVHDKQSELFEPKYYEDKSVYRRMNIESMTGQQRDYIPGENRFINLNDEHWPDQWYLNNNGQAGSPKGLDINVVPVWQQGYSGKGVTVSILDDGVQHEHSDLKDNYSPEASTDLNDPNDHAKDPTPDPNNLSQNSHGTRCAGEVAAKANNSVCGVGVAFNAKIGGVRILDGPVTDSLESQALLFNNQVIDIYSASWGPRDDGRTMEAPSKHCNDALKEGAEKGRGGKGSIFVWATGNGGFNGDDCAADGYVSSPYTLSIGSINNYAESTYFMEWCPSTLAVVYTGGYHDRNKVFALPEKDHPILKIITTDVNDKCTLNFQGTSSAAPLAAGVMALALEANKNLTWRDMQHLVVETSKIPNIVEDGWTINGAGYHINEKFGYGVIDVAQMVQAAQTWSNVGPQHQCEQLTEENLNLTFSNEKPLSTIINTNGCQKDKNAAVDKVEHVQMYVKLKHGRRGDIKLTLTSPAGTKSEMLSPRSLDDSTEGIDFLFMTVRCWGENPIGAWNLTINDVGKTESGGVLMRWGIGLWGTSRTDKTRSTGTDDSRKAYDPNKETLEQLMIKESKAAENVNIKKGTETDVIDKFASPHDKVDQPEKSDKNDTSDKNDKSDTSDDKNDKSDTSDDKNEKSATSNDKSDNGNGSDKDSTGTHNVPSTITDKISKFLENKSSEEIHAMIEYLQNALKKAKQHRELERKTNDLYERIAALLSG